MRIEISPLLQKYYAACVYKNIAAARQSLEAAFIYKKRLYFDEVENANVWSFYLVDRDLHHAFEEFLMNSGIKIPYAIWSRPEREQARDDIGRATFPIAEMATLYRKPVPRAGDFVHYVVETLELAEKYAVLGFRGYLGNSHQVLSASPSVVAIWLRVFVQYADSDRSVVALPKSLRTGLEKSLVSSAILA